MKTPSISRADLADYLGVTPQRISQLTGEGVFAPGKDGSYPALESLKAACEWLRDRSGVWDLKSAQLEKKNQLLDLQIKAAEGATLDAAEVEKGWVNLVLLVRGRLLQLPSKIAPKLTFAMSEAEMERELQKEIDDALTELSRPPAYCEAEDGGG